MRFIGGWMCVLSLVGTVGLLTGGAPYVLVAIWAFLLFLWGGRVLRVGVFERTPGCLYETA